MLKEDTMLIANTLERVFVMSEGAKEITLADPDRNWKPESVLNFYAATYPILTTARIQGPEIRDDKIYYSFESTIGTKG
jgi:PRTRC genetic system protein C